jgi:hypothetical protein
MTPDEIIQTERRRILRELEKLRARAVDAAIGPPRPTAESKAQAKIAYAFCQGVIVAMGVVAGIGIAKPGVDFKGSESWTRDKDYKPSPPKAAPSPAELPEANMLADKETVH